MITHVGTFHLPRLHEHLLEHLLERFLVAIDILAEFSVAVLLGVAVGWLIGLAAGRLYVENFQPVYLSQFGSLSEVSQWSLKPFAVAAIGAYVGGARRGQGTFAHSQIGARAWH